MDLDCIVMLVRAECLCSGQEVCWFRTKHFKAVDNNSCVISEGKLKALRHGPPKLFSLRPPNQWRQPHIHN